MQVPIGSAHRDRLAAAGITAAAILLAWRQRFVCDDAFIAYNYARNLVEGQGLTWFGTRVEGYTSFLWVAWTALGLRFGADPIAWSHAGSLAACGAAVGGTWWLACALLPNRFAAAAVIALLLTNFSFLAFATSGLETMLQTALLVHAITFALRFRRAPALRSGLGLGALGAAAVLTRPDSALPVAILLGFALRGAGARPRLALIASAALPLFAWAGWKLAYYGDILPNTFYAKAGITAPTLANGVRYLGRFASAYAWWLPSLALPLAWWKRAWRTETWLLSFLVVSWWIYLTLVGGDFMEFRMLVPLLPALCIVLVQALCAVGPPENRMRITVALVCGVLVGFSILHARRFTGLTPDRCLDSVPALADFYGVVPDDDWGRMGRRLAEELAGTDPLIALDAVGAVPYYSRLRTLDMFGLTDAWIARNGNPAPDHFPRPGHRRQVPIAELRRRGVHLVIGSPMLMHRGMLARPEAQAGLREWARRQLGFSHESFGTVQLLAIPMWDDFGLLMWYMTRTDALDALIRERGWETGTLAWVQ
jgi:arabinofuranosyltransferase